MPVKNIVKDRQFYHCANSLWSYAIVALIELLHAKSYAAAALIQLSYLMVNADSNTKVLILRKVSKIEYIKTDIGQHILQNGRTNNHYYVKKLANETTESNKLQK